MEKKAKIYIAGHNGMVGSAIKRKLESENFNNLIVKTRKELNLLRQDEVEAFFDREKPDYVFLAAAKVGGILANDRYSADFLYENLMIETNIIHAAWKNNCKKLLFLGSSCIYPKYAEQPMKEDALLTGLLETTNEAYAIAKIAGIKLCDMYRKQYNTDFISAMPTNLFGINDNFNLENSHVLPALMRKIHDAKINNLNEVTIWGTGKVLREFLYVDDLADACIFLMNKYSDFGHVNVGFGTDILISDLAELIKKIIGFNGVFVYDSSKPDGTARKLMDSSLIHNLGWKAKTSLEDGIKLSYQWFLENQNNFKQ